MGILSDTLFLLAFGGFTIRTMAPKGYFSVLFSIYLTALVSFMALEQTETLCWFNGILVTGSTVFTAVTLFTGFFVFTVFTVLNTLFLGW